jgi:hypothetical protein
MNGEFFGLLGREVLRHHHGRGRALRPCTPGASADSTAQQSPTPPDHSDARDVVEAERAHVLGRLLKPAPVSSNRVIPNLDISCPLPHHRSRVAHLHDGIGEEMRMPVSESQAGKPRAIKLSYCASNCAGVRPMRRAAASRETSLGLTRNFIAKQTKVA